MGELEEMAEAGKKKRMDVKDGGKQGSWAKKRFVGSNGGGSSGGGERPADLLALIAVENPVSTFNPR